MNSAQSRSEAQSARQTIPFTDEQIAEMAAMYAKVKSLRKVGKKFGINVNAVRSRLSGCGVEIFPCVQPALSKEQIRDVISKLSDGVKPCQLALQYGVHDSTIRKYAVRYGD